MSTTSIQAAQSHIINNGFDFQRTDIQNIQRLVRNKHIFEKHLPFDAHVQDIILGMAQAAEEKDHDDLVAELLDLCLPTLDSQISQSPEFIEELLQLCIGYM